MSLQDTINSVQAKIQGEIGRFLILKESILNLPSGPNRDALLSKQNDLEGRAMKMASDAAALKESMNYKGLDIFKALSQKNIQAVTSLANGGASLIKEMAAHKMAVGQAVGGSSQGSRAAETMQASFMSSQLGKMALVAGAAFAVNWAWRKSRSMAGSRA